MTREIGYPYAFDDIVQRVLQVNEGGTGGATPDAAADSLGVLKIKDLDTAGYAAKLPRTDRVNQAHLPTCVMNFPTVEVPTVHVNETVEITITNYDANMVVDLGTQGGSYYRIEDKIYFTAPKTSGKVLMLIRQANASESDNAVRSFEIDVLDPALLKPSIIYPTANQTEVLPNVAITASEAQASYGVVNYSKTEWQISTTSDFTNLVSLNDSIKPLYNCIIPGSLTIGKTYYARVRYLDSQIGYSEWSDYVKFTTKSSTALKSADTKFSDSTAGASAAFGSDFALSSDGTTLVVGVPKKTLGGVYFYLKDSVGAWVLKNAQSASGYDFGASIAVSADGSIVLVGRPTATVNGVTTAGSVAVYHRYSDKWAYEAELSDPSPASGGKFGLKTAISADGMIAAVTATRSGTDTSDYGYVMLFKAQADQLSQSTQSNVYTWRYTTKIAPTTGVTAGYGFGSSIAMAASGETMFVGAPNATVNSLTLAGAVYRYDLTAGQWTETYKIVNPTPTASEYFGASVSCTPGPETIVYGDFVCAIGATGGNSNKGKCHLYLGWRYNKGITASDGVAGDMFGCSVSLSNNARVLYIGANAVSSSAGAVYRFDYNGNVANTWSQTAKIMAEDTTAGYKFGSKVQLAGTEERVIISSPAATVSSVTGVGCVHSYM